MEGLARSEHRGTFIFPLGFVDRQVWTNPNRSVFSEYYSQEWNRPAYSSLSPLIFVSLPNYFLAVDFANILSFFFIPRFFGYFLRSRFYIVYDLTRICVGFRYIQYYCVKKIHILYKCRRATTFLCIQLFPTIPVKFKKIDRCWKSICFHHIFKQPRY